MTPCPCGRTDYSSVRWGSCSLCLNRRTRWNRGAERPTLPRLVGSLDAPSRISGTPIQELIPSDCADMSAGFARRELFENNVRQLRVLRTNRPRRFRTLVEATGYDVTTLRGHVQPRGGELEGLWVVYRELISSRKTGRRYRRHA